MRIFLILVLLVLSSFLGGYAYRDLQFKQWKKVVLYPYLTTCFSDYKC
jgi:DMSO/TMAO reductase YedYZ heme-binding membrane subunit